MNLRLKGRRPNPMLHEVFPNAEALRITSAEARKKGPMDAQRRQVLLAACTVSLHQTTPAISLNDDFQQHLLHVALDYERRYYELLAADTDRRLKAKKHTQKFHQKRREQNL